MSNPSTDKTHTAIDPGDFHHEIRKIGLLDMHMVIDGDQHSDPVIMLHGFPEFWYGWAKQIRPISTRGYRVIVPDQRGYNTTAKLPPYDVFTLTNDIANLITNLGYQSAHIVGHDWGGVIAWLFAARYPEMTRNVTVCNVPHPVAALDGVRRLFMPQILKSWYIGFFQLPLIPELALAANNYNTASQLMKSGSGGRVTDAELVHYRRAWANPGSFTAMIGWYRAFFRDSARIASLDARIQVPASLIWGLPDPALDQQTAEWTRDYCDDLIVTYVERAGHFVQHVKPERTSELILEGLRRQPRVKDDPNANAKVDS